MEGSEILTEGLKNWKLRIILSAILCIMGLAGLVSMVIGIFINLSIYDKSMVSIAIWMVGIPTYLILSGLSGVTPRTIAQFINENNVQIDDDLQILLQPDTELNEQLKSKKSELIAFFQDQPLYTFLPDKPVKQAYFLMLASMLVSFGIWIVT
jgi:hypothetical protein